MDTIQHLQVTSPRKPMACAARIADIGHCYREAMPLGSEEGRACAEFMFGPDVVRALPADRYGSPRGWLVTWSIVSHLPVRSMKLRWAMLAPARGSTLDDAWRGEFAGKADQELLRPGLVLLEGSIAIDWRRSLARALDLPTIDQHWPAE